MTETHKKMDIDEADFQLEHLLDAVQEYNQRACKQDKAQDALSWRILAHNKLKLAVQLQQTIIEHLKSQQKHPV